MKTGLASSRPLSASRRRPRSSKRTSAASRATTRSSISTRCCPAVCPSARSCSRSTTATARSSTSRLGLERLGLPSVFFVSAAFVAPGSLPLDNLLCAVAARAGLPALSAAGHRGVRAATSVSEVLAVVAGFDYARRMAIGDELAERFELDRGELRAERASSSRPTSWVGSLPLAARSATTPHRISSAARSPRRGRGARGARRASRAARALVAGSSALLQLPLRLGRGRDPVRRGRAARTRATRPRSSSSPGTTRAATPATVWNRVSLARPPRAWTWVVPELNCFRWPVPRATGFNRRQERAPMSIVILTGNGPEHRYVARRLYCAAVDVDRDRRGRQRAPPGIKRAFRGGRRDGLARLALFAFRRPSRRDGARRSARASWLSVRSAHGDIRPTARRSSRSRASTGRSPTLEAVRRRARMCCGLRHRDRQRRHARAWPATGPSTCTPAVPSLSRDGLRVLAARRTASSTSGSPPSTNARGCGRGQIFAVAPADYRAGVGVHETFARAVACGGDLYADVVRSYLADDLTGEPQDLTQGVEYRGYMRTLQAELRARRTVLGCAALRPDTRSSHEPADARVRAADDGGSYRGRLLEVLEREPTRRRGDLLLAPGARLAFTGPRRSCRR